MGAVHTGATLLIEESVSVQSAVLDKQHIDPAEARQSDVQQTNGVKNPAIPNQPVPELKWPSNISSQFRSELQGSSSFTSLGPIDQQKLLNVIGETLQNTPGESVVLRIESQFRALIKDTSVGRGLLQRDKDEATHTLLDSLNEMATGRFCAEELTARRGELLRSTIGNITSTFSEVDQGKTVSCVATVGTTQLAAEYSAEYVRMLSELSQNGSARLISEYDGKRFLSYDRALQLDYSSLDPATMKGRNLAETIMQVSAGRLVGGYASDGLYPQQAESVFESLIGIPFNRIDADIPGGREAIVAELKRATSSEGVNMVSLEWAKEGNHLNHAIQILGIEGDRVYFRNPWGSDFKNPDCVKSHLVNHDQAISWMPLSEFSSRLNYALISDQDRHAALGVTPGKEGAEGAVMFGLAPSELFSLLVTDMFNKTARLDAGQKPSQTT